MSYRLPLVALVRVQGESMSPGLRAGDLLLAVRRAAASPGAIVVVSLPREESGAGRPLAIKRLAGRDPADPARWWVERDNPHVGVDSWQVGSLPHRALHGVALARIWPHPRLLRARQGG